MINRALLLGSGLILAVLLAALGWQTIRVADLQTRIAIMAQELGEANTRIALLEASEATLLAVRSGLTQQVEACQQLNAAAQARTVERVEIIRKAKTVPVSAAAAQGPGGVVDHETSRRAAAHLNGCR